MERKLVTVRIVSAISPIPKADAIECASIEGWKVAVGKGEFRSGDRCVYFEIDSFLPVVDPRFSFLEKSAIEWEGCRGVRLRTMTMRGQISQGLALPLAKFPEIEMVISGKSPEEARQVDFAEVLGVVKWEAAIPQEMKLAAVGALPSVLNSPSLERIQNLPALFEEHRGEDFEATIKIDGMTSHVFRMDGRVRVGSQSWELVERADEPTWIAARECGLVEALDHPEFEGVQIQAELFGMGVAAGWHENRPRPTLAVFHAYDFLKGRHYSKGEREDLVERLRARGARIDCAPSLGVFRIDEFAGDFERLFALAEGPSLDPSRRREGVVLKHVDGTFAFKVISNKRLLKAG